MVMWLGGMWVSTFDKGKTKAVVFDMQRVHPENEGLDINLGTSPSSKREDWVTAAVASLALKLDD